MNDSKRSYRVIRFYDEDGEETYTIREVFYENNTPKQYTIRSEFPMSTNGLVGLQIQIDAYQKAMELPVINHLFVPEPLHLKLS